jgi:ABC-2 type transport system ATP-binding protein
MSDHHKHRVDVTILEDRLPSDVGPIRLEDVTKQYGSIRAVEGVTFRANPGEFHCLAGPNGSGKTTLSELTVGLTRPTSGSVTAPSDTIGFSFQRPRFYPGLTVEENLIVFGEAVDADPDEQWVRSIVSTLRLDHVLQQPAGELSGGFKKKFDLAVALLSVPSYLWLDEPLSDVDDLSKHRIRSLLGAYVDAGGGVVISTHNLEFFEELATHLTVFLDGHASEPVVVAENGHAESLWDCYESVLDDLASTA